MDGYNIRTFLTGRGQPIVVYSPTLTIPANREIQRLIVSPAPLLRRLDICPHHQAARTERGQLRIESPFGTSTYRKLRLSAQSIRSRAHGAP
jgi:hypothetical protein